jgi:hypothetical protein
MTKNPAFTTKASAHISATDYQLLLAEYMDKQFIFIIQ